MVKATTERQRAIHTREQRRRPMPGPLRATAIPVMTTAMWPSMPTARCARSWTTISTVKRRPARRPMPCHSSTPISVGRVLTIKPAKENAVARPPDARPTAPARNLWHGTSLWRSVGDAAPLSHADWLGVAPRSRGPTFAATSAWPPACAMPGCASTSGALQIAPEREGRVSSLPSKSSPSRGAPPNSGCGF